MKKKSSTSENLIEDSYKLYRESVLSYISYRINDSIEAEDLVQDTFLRLVDYKMMLRKDTIKYFIFSIARNLVTDYLRRFYKTQEINICIYESSPIYTNDIESKIISDDIMRIERNQIEKLPYQRKKIYMMSRYEEKTISEISSLLNLSQRTIENHLFIGRKEIREYIRKCI